MPLLSVLVAWAGEYGDATPLFQGLCGLALAICGFIGLLPAAKRRPGSPKLEKELASVGTPPTLEHPVQDRPDAVARLVFSLLKQALFSPEKQADAQRQLQNIVERRRLPRRRTGEPGFPLQDTCGTAAPSFASAQDVQAFGPHSSRQPKHQVLVSVLFLIAGVFLMISAYQTMTGK